ncbi:class I SAM-dependent methyltransferase [Actinomyces minihominis]|uniref:class I SAM-dependent methyltransferase n=1 Tax=Actinomyces minihominis TaxID=2002838 RepID=UPI000C0740A7|nr:class I SAM-dependent methyltransferase [Actinomyces minihominis]
MDGVFHLLNPQALALVDSLPPYDPRGVEELSRRLRAEGYEPDLVASALTQQHLRARGEAKFGEDARRMLFTVAGVQQATRAVVADLHASRFARAGCRTVADITSGVGADSMAFARAGLEVTAVEFDEVTAGCATHNLSVFPNAQVVNGDGLDIEFTDFDGVFADPARRGARGRTFNPADYSPPFDRVLAIRNVVPNLGVKVAPGIAYPDLPEDAHVQWVSVNGDVVEAGLWFGALAARPGRSALIISDGEMVELVATDEPTSPVVPMTPVELGRYIYEPDGAVIRSGGLHVLAGKLEAGPVSEGMAYLTGDTLLVGPLATAFEVIEAMPIKKLKQYLRIHEVGSLEILKRGVDIVPDQFRKGLKLKGDRAASVILTRLQGRHSAVVVKRLRRH